MSYLVISEQNNYIFGIYTDLEEAKRVFELVCKISSVDHISIKEVVNNISSKFLEDIGENVNIKKIGKKTDKLSVNDENYFNIYDLLNDNKIIEEKYI